MLVAIVAIGVAVGAAQSSDATVASACNARTLSVGHVTWVSPLTGVSMIGFRVINNGSSACTLRGRPRVKAMLTGHASIAATPGDLTMLGTRTIEVRPRGWSSVLMAWNHSCTPIPRLAYDHLQVTIGHGTFGLTLPRVSTSTDPDLRGRDLRLYVSKACPPNVSSFLAGSHLSR